MLNRRISNIHHNFRNETMQKIIKYTYEKITVKEFLTVSNIQKLQKSSDIPFITDIEYSPVTGIMKVTQIENN